MGGGGGGFFPVSVSAQCFKVSIKSINSSRQPSLDKMAGFSSLDGKHVERY